VSEAPRDEDIRVMRLGAGRYLVAGGSHRGVAFATMQGDAAWVFLDGRVHVVRSEQPGAGRRAGRQDDELAMAAPMPATVIAVDIVPGQQVAQGEVLITLEAMKMELAIKAPREAIVRSVSCRIGDLVQAGVKLVDLE